MKLLRRLLAPWQKAKGKADLPFHTWVLAQATSITIPSDKDLENAYLTSSVVAACVGEIVEAISALEVETIGVPYIKLLLERPNPRGTWSTFVSNLTRRYLCTGAGFILKQRQNGVMAMLRSVPTSAVTWLPDDTLRLMNGGQSIPLTWDDMPGMIVEDISNTHAWKSPLVGAWPEISVDIARTNYQRIILRNLADASLVIESLVNNQLEQREQLRKRIEQQADGQHVGGVLVLPKGYKATSPGKIRDISLSALAELCEARVSACLNVPAIAVGLLVGLTRSTYSNYEEARESLYAETIMPLAGRVSDFLTRVLIEDEGLSGEIKLVRKEDDVAKVPEETVPNPEEAVPNES